MKSKLKEVILDQVSEIEIFSHYLGCEVKLGKAMVSPLRQEKHPSFNVYQSPTNGRLYYKDFGDERGDCFKFIMRMYGCTFTEALHMVVQDFQIATTETKRDLSQIRKAAKAIRIPQIFFNPRKKLPYARARWTPELLKLWNNGGIGLKVLQEYNVHPVSKMKIPKRDGSGDFVLHSKEGDPIFCFDYEEGIKKFYRPFVKEKKYKFISNLRKGDIFGLKQLKEHVKDQGKVNILLICAGQKDCLSLYANTGIRGIALNSESASLTSDEIIGLMEYTDKLLVCYDNDETGRKHANKIKQDIGIDHIDLGQLAPADKVNDIYDYFKLKLSADNFIKLVETHGN